MHQKTGGGLEASCRFQGLQPIARVMSPDTVSHEVLLSQTQVVRQDPWEARPVRGHGAFGGSVSRTKQTVMESYLHGWLYNTSWSQIFLDLFASLRERHGGELLASPVVLV